MTRQLFRLPRYRDAVSLFLCLMLGSAVFVAAQRRNSLRPPTGFDDVVFAIAFSPDGETLAIARGADEPSQRFARIELWDLDTGKLRRVIKGFDGPVKSFLFSPDGQTIISASIEYRSSKIQDVHHYGGTIRGELKWWDNQTGELKNRIVLPGEVPANFKLAMSPDGKDLVVGETFMIFAFVPFSPTIQQAPFGATPFPMVRFGPPVFYNSDTKLFDATTGEIKLKLNDDQTNSMVYSPDGATLALAQRGEVRLYNSQTGKEDRKLKGFKGRANAAAFSPDGRLLAVASTTYEHESDGDLIKLIGISQVKLFETRTWRELRKISEVGAVNTLTFSSNGKRLLMGGVMRRGEKDLPGVNVLNLETGLLANFPTGEDFTESVEALKVSTDGKLVALRSGPASVKMLDGNSLTVKQTWDEHSVGDVVERPVSRFLVSAKRVLAVAFSSDGSTVTAETDRGEIKSWDPRTGEVKNEVKVEQNNPALVMTSADGKSFAELGEGNVSFWSVTSTVKQVIPLPDNRRVSAMTLSADGRHFALAAGNEILLIDADGKAWQTLEATHGGVTGLAFSNDARTLATVTETGVIEIWNSATDRVEQILPVGSEVTALKFSPNNQMLAVATADRVATIWNTQTGQALMKLDKHNAAINAFAFSSDGQLMASGSDDCTAVIWDLRSGKSKRSLKGHDQTVSALAFSPDDKILASGSGNASVVLWEVRSGKFTRVLR